MSDIAGTKVKFFGPLSPRRAGNFDGNRAELEQNNGAESRILSRTEAIFISIAGRQNQPSYEQNLSKPSGKLIVVLTVVEYYSAIMVFSYQFINSKEINK